MLTEVQDSSSEPQLYLDLETDELLDLHDLEVLELDLAPDLEQDEREAEQRLPRLLDQGWSQEFFQFSDRPRTCTAPVLQPSEDEGQEHQEPN